MNQVELCQIWKALLNLNLQYLPFFLLLWLPLYDFLYMVTFLPHLSFRTSGVSVHIFLFDIA